MCLPVDPKGFVCKYSSKAMRLQVPVDTNGFARKFSSKAIRLQVPVDPKKVSIQVLV